MLYRPMRLPCYTSLRLVEEGEERPVRLVNLGATGARLSGTGTLSPGAEVILAHLSFRVRATVVWRRGTEAGLRFVRPLATGEITALRGAETPSGWGTGGARFRELT